MGDAVSSRFRITREPLDVAETAALVAGLECGAIATFIGTVRVHEHGSRIVAHAHRTITTSDGFVGRGTDTFVDNGRVVAATLNDMLANASGDRFRARFVFVLDVSTGTVRVDKGGLTCLGP